MHHQSQSSQKLRRGFAAAIAGALLAALLPAAFPAAVPGVHASAAAAPSVTLCSGFDACERSGRPHGGYKSAKSKMYWNMFSGVNCTNYVGYRMIQAGMPAPRPAELKSGKGNATYWGTSFGNKTDTTPTVGSIAWWKARHNGSGSAGHVALVEQVLANGDIVISESNYGSEFTWRQITKGGNRWPTGFIHLVDKAVAPKTAPTISGAAQVGRKMTAKAATWSPTPSKTTYRWLANGVAITGATAATFTPTASELGKTISVRATATRSGYATGTSTSTATASVAAGTHGVTSDPVVIGTPQIDQELSVDPGDYSPAADRTSVQWLADGTPVAGATATRFVPTLAQVDTKISARVTVSKTGYRPLVRTTAQTTPVLAPQLELTSARIEGAHLVGQAVTARAASSAPGTTYSYVWRRGGKQLATIKGASYTLKTSDIGQSISVTLIASARGYRARSLTLPAFTDTKIGVGANVTTAIGKKNTLWVRMTLKPSTGPKPTGKVMIKVGNVKKAGVIGADGSALVHFTKAGTGTKSILARWKGGANYGNVEATGKVTIPGKTPVKPAPKPAPQPKPSTPAPKPVAKKIAVGKQLVTSTEAGRTLWVKLILKPADGKKATGTVKFKVAGIIRSAQVRADGSAIISFPGLKAGKQSVKATWSGGTKYASVSATGTASVPNR